MINTSTINADGVKQRNRRVMLGCVALIFAAGISVGLYFIFANGGNVVDTKKTQQQIRNGEGTLILGDYEICNWEAVDFDTHIPLMIDGKDEGFFDVEDELLVQGYLCGTVQEVLLAIDEQGLHGSILSSDNVVQITAIDEDHSTLAMSDKGYPEFTESDKTEAADEKWKKYMASKHTDRREMQALEPGSIDIHIHLDIDSHMVETYGSAYAAARYGVELIAVVNRDAFVGLGFNLKVVSINARTSFLSQTSSTSAYLTALERIPRPVNVNLVHSLSTRSLGGGIAYVGGLYTRLYCYGVSEIYGNFARWDRYVVAHELGHNFGADHTHEMSPQVDTCGFSCPSDPTGTIMSYCHQCNGGLSNIEYEWHPRVRDVILDAYAFENGKLAARYDCQTFPTYPDIGVPFSLKGDDCLTINTAACADCSVETCSLDSVFFFTGSQIKASQDESFCWTASADCDSISLQTCGDSTNQQFSFESDSLTSASCGQVMHDNGSALFAGSSLVSSWCSPSVNPNDGPTCDQPVIPLECGGTHSGSTVNDCEGQRRFTFVAPEGSVTVSSCGTSFDSILSIEKDGDRLHYSDDDGNCNTRAELVNINDLAQGVEYTIVLEGFGSAVGSYDIALTCSNDDPNPITTAEPTEPTDDDCDSTPIELECGAPVTGSTENVCNGEQRFVFEATTTMKTISTCGSDYDTMIFVYDSNDNLLDDNDDHRGCGLQSHIDNLSLDVGAEYYVILTGYSNAVGGYTIELTCQDPPSLKPTTGAPSSTPTIVPAPQVETLPPTTGMPSSSPSILPSSVPTIVPAPQVDTLSPTTSMPSPNPTIVPAPQVDTLSPSLDPTMDPTSEPGIDCAPAIALGCGDILSGSTVGTCNNEQRFVFTATTNLKTISACGSSYDTYLTLYNSNNVRIATQDDSYSDHCGYFNSLLESDQLTIGAEYTVVLSGYASAVGDYKMELICGAPQVETLAPTTAMPSAIPTIVPAPQVETLSPTTDPTMDPTSPPTTAMPSSSPTIVPAPQAETLSPTTDPTMDPTSPPVSTLDPTMDPTSPPVSTLDPTMDPTSSPVSTLDPTMDPTSSPFSTLDPTMDPTSEPGLDCAPAIALGCGDILSGSTVGTCNNEQRFVFTATTDLKTISACGSDYDTYLTLYDSNNVPIAAQDDSQSSHCGYLNSLMESVQLTIGAEYTVVLSGFQSQVGDYSMELVCDVSPPEECESAIVDITCGETLTGSTVNSCDGTKAFAFTATTNLKTISTCDSDFDTILYLYGPGGELIHHNDDSDECNYQSFMDDYPVEVGAQYQIVLVGYGNEVGSYKIELTCDNVAPCDDSIQTLTCGDIVTQSTLDRCDGVQTFAFTATTELTTISTCGSGFDTMLAISSDNGFSASNDGFTGCGRHAKLHDMALDQGDYVVTLSGYDGIRGDYRLEVTCNNPVTYTEIPRGKCTTLDGSNPSHRWHANTRKRDCEQLCTDRSDCGGYSWSRYNHCLLWTQSDLMGGGAQWGGCSCHIKDGF